MPDDRSNPARLPINRRFALQMLSLATLSLTFSSRTQAAMTGSAIKPVPMPAQVPVKEGIASVAGTELAYWDTGGTGQPIVLLHPATGTAHIWGYQQPVFVKAGYRVIAYSRRGYDRSLPVPKDNPGTAAGDLHGLAQFLGLNKFHLAGSAAGGGIAVDYALSHPERLLSLVIACAVGGVQDKDWIERGEALRPKGFDQMPAIFRELSPAYRAANPEGTAQWAALEQKAVTGNRLGQQPANRITWASLTTLRAPTLVIGGEADLAMPGPLLESYANHIPGAELVLVPEAGHSLYWERPDVFNRALLDFFAKHRA